MDASFTGVTIGYSDMFISEETWAVGTKIAAEVVTKLDCGVVAIV
jgi:hypothetical protein